MARSSGTSSDPGRRGFTLVELAVVVALLAVIAAVAVPRFASASARARLDAATARVVNDISITAASARAAGASRQIVFSAGTDEYLMIGVPSRGAFTNRQVQLAGQPYDTNLVSASFDGSPLLAMNGYGVADFGGSDQPRRR
jgi:prepilin-type N-terminal cleavage/methylation domain-containing protein